MNLKKNLIVFGLTLLPLVSFSEVNLKNGGFHITYTDVKVSSGDNALEITRTYNSKSKSQGWFGVGWGSTYETKLVVSGDGSIVILENGSGNQRHFLPLKNSITIDSFVQKITEAIKANKDFISDTDLKSLVSRLKSSFEYRLEYSRKYKIEESIASGSAFYSSSGDKQTIIKEKDRYIRSFFNGDVQYFDNTGKLLRVESSSGYFVNLKYKDELVQSLIDSKNSQIILEWYPKKTVKAASATGSVKSKYEYDEYGNLINSIDIAGNRYKYTYDQSDNLTSITYADKSKLQINYTKESSVIDVLDTNGDVTNYKFEKDSKRPDLNYWAIVTKKYADGVVAKSRFEYEMKLKENGQQYLYKTKTELSGIKTETIYSDKFALPLQITQDNNVATFEYNDNGLMTKKNSRGATTQIEYDGRTSKVTKISNADGVANYQYDKDGNLIKAENEDRAVIFTYGKLGEIVGIVEQEKNDEKSIRTYTLKYNLAGKPTFIEIKNIGSISAEYNSYGEIKKIESKGGDKMADTIHQAIRSLEELVRPAGVNFNL